MVGLLIMGLTSLGACNKKTEETESLYDVSSMVGITGFSLKENKEVADSLSAVFFSIDLKHGVIFNADSLPVGTKINKLIPVINYPSTISAMEIVMDGGSYRQGTVNYITNPSDTIDFSGTVMLNVTAQDGNTKASYRIKVNVHQWEPDSLIWDNIAVAKLPSRLATPREQKSLERNGSYFSLICENDGTFTLSTTDDLFTNEWHKEQITLPFVPQINTFSASSESFFILSDSGRLMTSSDAKEWNDTGKEWLNIIGGYEKSVQGIRNKDGIPVHTSYPTAVEYALEENFPLSGYSNFQLMDNKWAASPIGMIVGGRLNDGTLVNTTWGFDGENWAVLSENGLPQTEGMSLVPYFSFKKSNSVWHQTEFSVWMALGGQMSDGSFNRKIYISFNNGINWQEGGTMLQFPEYFPLFYKSDILIDTMPMNANLTDGWTGMSTKNHPGRRISYKLDGYEVSWDCPYIFIIGGYDATGHLLDSIWRGVLGRLTFTPIF